MATLTKGLWLLVFSLLRNEISSELTGIINTDRGSVQGEILRTTEKSMPYSAFKGIPYGKPPLANLRFKPPEEPTSWQNVLRTTSEPNQCAQIDFLYKNFSGSEDCLYLNVYTPVTRFNGLNGYKPVMVWIHGGTFKNGYINSSLYGPDYLLEHDVVVVAMNYRVGPLGFLALDLPEATGNMGLKDQNLALQWVKKNIAKFGGDPNSITLFGQSAGAVAVDLHVLSEQSRGLFHRAIAMSGSPLCIWGFATPTKAKLRAFELGGRLGINTNDKKQLLKKLQEASARDLVTAAEEMHKIDPPFKPTIENEKTAGKRAFLTECTVNKYKSGDFNRVPYITGFTAKETVSYASSVQSFVDMVDFAIDSVSTSVVTLPPLSLVPFLRNIKDGAVDAINSINYALLDEAVNQTTDLLFVLGIDTKQTLLAAVNDVPVYYYRLSFDSQHSLHRLRSNITLNGTAHEDDIPYLFHAADLKLPTRSEHPVVLTRKRMTKMWTNFAKYGNPTPNGTHDGDLNVIWPKSGSSGDHLEIADDLSVGPRPTDTIVEILKLSQTPGLGLLNGCTPNLLKPLTQALRTLQELF